MPEAVKAATTPTPTDPPKGRSTRRTHAAKSSPLSSSPAASLVPPSPPASTPHQAPAAATPAASPPPPSSSSLDNPETTSQKSDSGQWPPMESLKRESAPCESDAEFRHSCWHQQRDATWNVMRQLNFDGTEKNDRRVIGDARLAAFGGCGGKAFVYAASVGPEDYCVKGSHCHDRFCVPCAIARTCAVTERLKRLAEGRELRFVTLTLRGRDGEKLTDQLDRLWSGLRQLRRLTIWDDAVDGGAAVCEVKRTDKGRWHSHLHLIVEGRFIDQRRLSHAWRAITGDSFIVDVRQVRDAREAVTYVAKYASKPMDAGFWRVPALLAEAIIALHGRRLIVTFGTWYGKDPDLDDADADWTFSTDPRRWVMLDSLAKLWARAMAGDVAAKRVHDALRVRDPLTGERPPPIPPPGSPTPDRPSIADNVISHFQKLAEQTERS